MYPRKFPTEEDFEKAVNKFLDHCRDEEIPITVVGFAHYVGMAESKLHENYKRVEPFSKVYSKLKTAAKNDILTKALKGEYNASIAKLVLSVNHGMRDTVQIESTHNTFHVDTSAAKLLDDEN